MMLLPGLEGEERSKDLSQWYTPPALAERVWEWGTRGMGTGLRVLEPAAGQGSLVKPALRDLRVRRVTAVDIDPRNAAALKQLPHRGHGRLAVVRGDFRSFTPRDRFDIGLTNPPYENDQDVDFILNLLGFAPRVVGIFRSALVHGSDDNPKRLGRWERLWSRVDLTRLVWLCNRPKFGEGTGALSDFIVAEFVRREGEPRRRGEPLHAQLEWW